MKLKTQKTIRHQKKEIILAADTEVVIVKERGLITIVCTTTPPLMKFSIPKSELI